MLERDRSYPGVALYLTYSHVAPVHGARPFLQPRPHVSGSPQAYLPLPVPVGHPQVVPAPRWKIPPSAWGTVLQRGEQGEPLRHDARAYGVSHEAVRRVLHASRRRSVGRVSTDQPPGQESTQPLHGQAKDVAGPSRAPGSSGTLAVYHSRVQHTREAPWSRTGIRREG